MNLAPLVRALQLKLIDEKQFAEVCADWLARRDVPLSVLLLQRGWIKVEDLTRLRDDTPAPTSPLVDRALAALDASGSAPLATHDLATVDEPRTARPPELATPPDRYSLIKVEGKGGMGQIWRARDTVLHREVALKELRTDRAEHVALGERLMREARITGRLQHPGIVPVYDLVPILGRQFYTMRLVEGRNLKQTAEAFHKERTGKETERQQFRALIGAFVSICNTMAYAHHRRVIHRDLKGDNVIVGQFGEVIILDWGLAKDLTETERLAPEEATDALNPNETQPGQVVGTPSYMAPEQATGNIEAVGPLSDVYGLGAILYLILTGQAPFVGTKTIEVLQKVREEPPQAPHQLWSGAPRALEAICLRTLAKKPEERYASPELLAADVQRWLDDEPVSAYRDPLPTRLMRFARRHKPIVTAVAALLVTTILALSIGIVFVKQEERKTAAEAQRAGEAEQEARKQVKLARESLHEGLAAIHLSLDRTSEVHFARVPGLQQDQYALLLAAANIYQKLLAIWSDDPEIRAEAGKGWFRLGNSAYQIAPEKDALALLERAYGYQQGLGRDAPDKVQHQLDLASTALKKGGLRRRLGDHNMALQDLQEAREIQERLLERPEVANDPNKRVNVQNALGLTYLNIGQTALELNDIPLAHQCYLEGVRILEEALRTQPKNTMVCNNLAEGLKALSYSFRSQRQPDKAVTALLSARDLLLNLPAQEQQQAMVQKVLGDIYNALYLAYDDGKRPKEAEASLNDAVQTRRALVRDNMAVPSYKAECGSSLTNLGEVHRKQGNVAEMLACWGEAVTMYESALEIKGDVVAYRDALTILYVILEQQLRQQKRTTEAIALLGKLRVLAPQKKEVQFLVGVGYSQCAAAPELSAKEREKCVGLGIAALREAVRLGFSDAQQFRKGVNFVALQGHRDYAKLLEEAGIKTP